MPVLNSATFRNATALVRDDPKVLATTKVTRPWLGADVAGRLEGVATRDSDHITPNQPGPQVAAIHQALEKLATAAAVPVPPQVFGQPTSDEKLFNDAIKAVRGSPITTEDRSKAVYGASTASAIKAYKVARNIRRGSAPVDNVVGILTIRALDRDLQRAAGITPGPVVPPAPAGPKPTDILVLFSGAPSVAVQGTPDKAAKAEFEKDTNTAAYLAGHMPAVGICHFGGRGQTDKSTVVARQVESLRERAPTGITVVIGVSVGGFPALQTAALLSAAKVRLDLVAINDGAFFAATGDIATFDPLAIKVPNGIKADDALNFSQTRGNDALRTPKGKGGFMDGTEFHGPLPGFSNVDLNDDPKVLTINGLMNAAFLVTPEPLRLKVNQKFASDMHVAAVAAANPKIDVAVKRLIKA